MTFLPLPPLPPCSFFSWTCDGCGDGGEGGGRGGDDWSILLKTKSCTYYTAFKTELETKMMPQLLYIILLMVPKINTWIN